MRCTSISKYAKLPVTRQHSPSEFCGGFISPERACQTTSGTPSRTFGSRRRRKRRRGRTYVPGEVTQRKGTRRVRPRKDYLVVSRDLPRRSVADVRCRRDCVLEKVLQSHQKLNLHKQASVDMTRPTCTSREAGHSRSFGETSTKSE